MTQYYGKRLMQAGLSGCLAMLVLLAMAAPGSAGDAAVKVQTRPGLAEQLKEANQQQVVQKDGWRLETEVLQPGTRSQGYHGELYHDGKPVEGTMGQTMETPLGTVKYNGSMMERKHLWSHSGWKLTKPAAGVDASCPGPDMMAPRRMHNGDGPPGATLK